MIRRRKHLRDPWQVYLDGQLIGNNQLANLTACVHANEWAIRKGLQ